MKITTLKKIALFILIFSAGFWLGSIVTGEIYRDECREAYRRVSNWNNTGVNK